MNPTPEQVAQWAREEAAFFDVIAFGRSDGVLFTPLELHRLVIRAMAEQAETDAALCKKESRMHLHQDRNGRSCHVDYANVAETCANAILANKPRLTTKIN